MKNYYHDAATWAAINPTLAAGSFGFITDEDRAVKIGNGSSTWAELPTVGAGGGGTIYAIGNYASATDPYVRVAPTVATGVRIKSAGTGGYEGFGEIVINNEGGGRRGDINITGGYGDELTDTHGGMITLRGGSSRFNGAGKVRILGGDGQYYGGYGMGGGIDIKPGYTAGYTETGADTKIYGGQASYNAGDLLLYGGQTYAYDAGKVAITGGYAGAGIAGNVEITGGVSNSGICGEAHIRGGNGSTPGKVLIQGGEGDNPSAGAEVQIYGGIGYGGYGGVKVAQENGKVGFFGVTPVLRQALAADPTPAAISTVLRNLGLVS